MAKLRTLYAAAEDPIDWGELAERLSTGRTGKQVQSKCTTLGLRQREKAAAGGPAWEAQRCHGTVEKNPKRKAAKAALTLASPAGVPPSEPRPKRPTAAAAKRGSL